MEKAISGKVSKFKVKQGFSPITFGPTIKKTKTICTIGPSSNSIDSIKALLKSGMNVARLNMSHGDIKSHQKTLDLIKKAREEMGIPCAIMVDTCGPEMRIGTFKNGKVELKKGQKFVFSTIEISGSDKGVYFGFPKLLKILKPRQVIYANNGLIEFVVSKIDGKNIVCKVSVGGILSDHKSVSIPHVRLPLPFISPKDEENIKFAVKNDVEFISASFVSRPSDVLSIKKLVASLGGRQRVISKIESFEGMENIDSILQESDGIMIARGDLGTELPIEEIPALQKPMIKLAISRGKYVIVATEMLESMTTNIRPTRAETTDVAGAVYDKACATMLSGETASGEYPELSCKTMSDIALATERYIDYDKEMLQFFQSPNQDLDAISYSACATSRTVDAKAIVCYTDKGKTANMVSRFRPQAPILAITHDDFTFNLLSLSWGVLPIKCPEQKTLDKMVSMANKIALEQKFVKKGDKIVITLGLPTEKKGITNAIHISQID